MIDENGYDELGRPCWDLYYMNLCLNISMKSLDPDTKHGCIYVDKNHIPLIFGYNSPPANMYDELIPLTRPEKYPYFIHAEVNAIDNAAKNGISLRNSTMYISGKICSKCLIQVLSINPERIVEGPITSHCVDPKDLELRKDILSKHKGIVNIVDFIYVSSLTKINKDVKMYLERKNVHE